MLTRQPNIRIRIGAILLLGALALGTLGVAAFWPPRDEWTRAIETGDSRMASADGRSARASYLLASLHAQDVTDVPRMLIAAGRLERLGEHHLAAHVRRVARVVAAERATSAVTTDSALAMLADHGKDR